VPAVTAACTMIERELYVALGGFRGLYIQGDYEDSDLCLRLLDLGFESWYFAPVELYHLESQSYPAPLQERATAYDRWLHTRLWGDRIASIMARLEPDRLLPEGPKLTQEINARRRLARDL
jgi:GT2 family glycosyltransferase